LDGDGDMDLLAGESRGKIHLYENTGTHGLGWLENRGSFPFTYHRLAHLPGAHTSLCGDLDGDGDLDLVSSAFIPSFNPSWPNAGQWDAVIWLQQTSPGRYKRYALESGTPFHPVADLGDIDDDGDIDVVLGNFSMLPLGTVSCDWNITVLEIQLVPGKQSP